MAGDPLYDERNNKDNNNNKQTKYLTFFCMLNHKDNSTFIRTFLINKESSEKFIRNNKETLDFQKAVNNTNDLYLLLQAIVTNVRTQREHFCH